MNFLKPGKLKQGDTIGFLSTSGVIKDLEGLERSKKYFEDLGFKVKISDTTYSQKNYLCGDDKSRAKALNDFFEDEEIKAILCTRGGYGAIRIIDKIDYDLICKNPKIFCGYSDISALLWMIYKKSNLITFHGAHALSTFSSKEDITRRSFHQLMNEKTNFIKVKENNIFYSGTAKGRLIGGNLCTITSMCGRDDFVPDNDVILFFEDLNEPTYKIDRMFVQLLNTKGFFDHVKGIALGEFTDIDNEKYFTDFLKEFAQELKIPIAQGFSISHTANNEVVPYGINIEFDANNGKIKFLENYFQ